MRLIFIVLTLTLCGPAAFAQDSLPEPLAALLRAAHESEADDDFPDAVRLIALTRDAATIVDAAAAIDADRGVQARTVLGLPEPGPSAPQAVTAGAADAEARTETVPPPLVARAAAAPVTLARQLASGESEAWEGRAQLGLRFDSGNSDRQDYTVGLAAKRALAVWGFEAGLTYAYSQVNGAVGRDEFGADARLEREAGDRWTLFTSAEYEQDALDGYDWTAFVNAGAGYRVLDRPERAWVLRAGPGARIVKDAAGRTLTDPALELSSDFEWQVSEPVRFSSDTSALISENSRAEQVFKLDTALGELWSLALTYRYTYEFEPEPGFENEDSRTDLAVVRRF